jgi:hypothetical protein
LLHRLHQEIPASYVTKDELMRCLRGADAESLLALAEKRLQQILREGPEAEGDGYLERACIAVSAGLRGDFEPLTALLERCAPHPEVVGCALRATVALRPELAEQCRQILAQTAPGLLLHIEASLTTVGKGQAEVNA